MDERANNTASRVSPTKNKKRSSSVEIHRPYAFPSKVFKDKVKYRMAEGPPKDQKEAIWNDKRLAR